MYNLRHALTIGSAMKEKASRAFGLDYRSLALLRVSLAGLMLADLWWRSRDLRAFYVRGGMLVPDEFYQSNKYQISVHGVCHALFAQVLLFALHAFSCITLLVGYRTTTSAVVAFVLLSSLHTHLPVVSTSGDDMLRILLFWSLFLPLGHTFSLDAALRNERVDFRNASEIDDAARARRRPTYGDFTTTSMATLALITTIACVELTIAATKSGVDWWNGRFVRSCLD
jgi:hypothetical protein